MEIITTTMILIKLKFNTFQNMKHLKKANGRKFQLFYGNLLRRQSRANTKSQETPS